MTLNANNTKTPTLFGLVLAGGKSTRMGQDKGAIQWHGKEQLYYMADMLHDICDTVFISCRQEQQPQIDTNYKTLTDAYAGSGPLGAILTAFKTKPGVAWLITACDLPLLDTDTLNYLVRHRNTSCIATTFESPFDHLPEPLITIWEPAAYPILDSFLSGGFTCPRKALLRNIEQVSIVAPPNPDALLNANTPEDAEKVRKIIVAAKIPHL